MKLPSPEEAAALADSIDRERREADLKAQAATYRRKYESLLTDLNVDARYQRFIGRISECEIDPPKWLAPGKLSKRHVAIPTALLSDAHFDEIVDPRQVLGVNGYNREIATKRLKNFFINSIKLGDSFVTGIDYPGFVLAVAGDLFSGDIHDELRETNEDVLYASILYWLGPMSAGIKMLAERYGKVFIPWVVGNHGRATKKPQSKRGVRANVDWLLGQLLAREFAGDSRVTFAISESFDLPYKVYGTRYMLTHGNQFRGGSGISGVFAPLFIGDARKRKKQQSVKQPYDVLVMGHWHQYLPMESLIINGSIKGYCEYADNSNFSYEPPRQAWWLTDPDHGITLRAPIFVQDESEQWARAESTEVEWLNR